MPLSFAEKDHPYKIIKVTGKDSICAHLHSLGLTENETVSVKQRLAGSLIVEVKGIRIALDENMAKRILV